MSRFIDADKLMEVVMATCVKEMDVDSPIEGMSIVLDKIYKAPTVDANHILDSTKKVDAVPVKHGHWIKKINPNYSPFDPCSSEELHICNQCGREQEFGTRFCPDCGAKMDG